MAEPSELSFDLHQDEDLELARGAEALAHVKIYGTKQLGSRPEQHKLNS